MSRMQRDKGKVGERELARFLTDNGYAARRGVQYSGGPESPDIACRSLPFHFEVKRTERLRVHDAMRQAIRDAGDNTPAVAHRRNREDWLITMRLSDLLGLLP